jgi:hypothetical protein
VAEAADQCSRPEGGSRPWLLRPSENPDHPGYPQTIMREGDVILVAECYDGIGPEGPWAFAEHITTFDPPTVLRLLDRIETLQRIVVQQNASIDVLGEEVAGGTGLHLSGDEWRLLDEILGAETGAKAEVR